LTQLDKKFFNRNKISEIICVQYSMLEDSCFYSSLPVPAEAVALHISPDDADLSTEKINL